MQLFDEAMAVMHSRPNLPCYSERYVILVDRITDCIHVLYAEHKRLKFDIDDASFLLPPLPPPFV